MMASSQRLGTDFCGDRTCHAAGALCSSGHGLYDPGVWGFRLAARMLLTADGALGRTGHRMCEETLLA